MKKLQARLRYDENFQSEYGECYVLEIRSDTKNEYGLCMAAQIKDGKISTDILAQIQQLIEIGYTFISVLV